MAAASNRFHRDALALKVDWATVPIFAGDFAAHSLSHTMLTRLSEPEVDADTIMRIAGHRRIVVRQRYIHPGAEAVEQPCRRWQLSAMRRKSSRSDRYPLQLRLHSDGGGL